MSDSPLTIGIDFGGTTVKLAVVFQGHIIDHSPPIATQDFSGHEELIDEMVRAVEDIRVRHPGIAALGVGMPGFVNFEKGIVNNLTNVPGWADVPLKKILEKRVGLPVVFTPFKEHLFAQLSGPFKDQLRVMPAAFGNEAGAIGAAALAREALDSSADSSA